MEESNLITYQYYQNEENLYQAFPDADNIFFSDVEKKVLLPIGIVDKSHFGTDSDIIIAIPIEPVEGYLGDDKESYWIEGCSENWLSYTIVDGKCKLDCPKEFFYIYEDKKGYSPNILEYYAETVHSYQQAKDQFNNGQYNACLIELGGYVTEGGENWSAYLGDIPRRTEPAIDENGESYDRLIMQDSQGRDYLHIGRLWRNTYDNQSDADAIIFYEPTQKRVLITFDYS